MEHIRKSREERTARMTRTYALRRLLEHGPLTKREMGEITGWTAHSVWHAIEDLMVRGVVTSSGLRRSRVYSLAD